MKVEFICSDEAAFEQKQLQKALRCISTTKHRGNKSHLRIRLQHMAAWCCLEEQLCKQYQTHTYLLPTSLSLSRQSERNKNVYNQKLSNSYMLAYDMNVNCSIWFSSNLFKMEKRSNITKQEKQKNLKFGQSREKVAI